MVLSRATIAAACVLALFSAGLFVGCNDTEQGVDEPAREGLALDLDGVTYNVFITRQLNTAIPPDNAYYAGPQPNRDETLYGVFIQACNHTKDHLLPTSLFKVKDNQDNEFTPVRLPADSPSRRASSLRDSGPWISTSIATARSPGLSGSQSGSPLIVTPRVVVTWTTVFIPSQK